MCCIFCTSSLMELQVFVSLYWDLWNAREEKETIHADWIIIIHLLCQLNLYALRSDVWVAPSGFFPSCLHQMEGNPTVQNKLDQRALEELRPSIMGIFILFPDISFNFLCWKKSMLALSQYLLSKRILVSRWFNAPCASDTLTNVAIGTVHQSWPGIGGVCPPNVDFVLVQCGVV